MQSQYPDWDWSSADAFEASPTMEFFRQQGVGGAGANIGLLMIGRRRYVKRSNRKATICVEWATESEFSVLPSRAPYCNIYCNDGSKITGPGATREALKDIMCGVDAWFRDRRREIAASLDEEARLSEVEERIAATRLIGLDAARARYLKRED